MALVVLGTGALRAQNQVSLTVDATMDIYRAGGYDDGSDGVAPVVFSFPAKAWRRLSFPTAGGAWSCQSGYPEYGADGETSGHCVSAGGFNLNPVGPFSGYHLTDFSGALAGVFLEDALPESAAAALRFYVSDGSKGGTQTDFASLSPKIGQVFFIGDGLTGTGIGTTQAFNVPSTATHLYLGYVESCVATNGTVPGCYSDNAGSISVTARLLDYAPDWVEPTLTSAPSARIGSSMTYDPATQSTVLFGGNSAFEPGSTYDDTWAWRGAWMQLAPKTSPPARGSAGLAYDPSTGTLVLFGGSNNSDGSVFGDTWTWDGVTWTQQFPPVSPMARSARQSMVYDRETQTVLLFGGTGPDNGDYGGTPFGDTWGWNGRTKTWTQMFPAVSPSARWAPLANDANSGDIVLFGGDNGGGDCCRVYYNDTWTWDGVTWTLQSPSMSPPARTAQTMAYDAGLLQVIMFGGTSGPPEALNDTWGWDGLTWKQLKSAGKPSARYVSVMDFDLLSHGLLLFGGELSGDTVTNETWLFVPVAIR